MPNPNLTLAEWKAALRRALTRAVKLTKSKPKAKEIRDAAVATALEPDTTPWDPERQTFPQYLSDLVWSRYGNESKSYRVTMASERITEETDQAPPSSRNPDRLMIRQEEEARGERLRAALQARIKDDSLIQLLLEHHDEDYEQDEAPGGGSDDVPGDDPEAPPPKPTPAKRVPEPATTRRALAKGYTLKDIKNARERLKRHAIAVVQTDQEAKS